MFKNYCGRDLICLSMSKSLNKSFYLFIKGKYHGRNLPVVSKFLFPLH